MKPKFSITGNKTSSTGLLNIIIRGVHRCHSVLISMHSGFEVSSSIYWIHNMVCVWQHLKPPGFWKFTHGCASRKAMGREIKSIPRICLPQWIKHHLPPMIGEVNIFNLSPWNIPYQKLSINFCVGGWAHRRGGSQIRLVSGMSWHSLHTEPSSLLPWPFCALSQQIWKRQRKKLSDCHRTGHMSADYGELPPMLAPLWVVVWWWLSLYSAYSARLILISPPRAPSHQFSKCAFPKALISKGKLLAIAHETL